ncbi:MULTISPECIES: tautomerase family protein [Micromonospora]|jgi:4-oxalocrotonate tautomerase|uniref:4-oxalocrotonate tautomerase n=2 Tax=Micromonospora TaxID=1873 RepID=A0A1C5G8Y0_MICEH|nr:MULTISPECIES: tautomerase family protein [Micromonospora]MBQ1074259.1 tautomerase family protein [Micromonospora sp. C31]MCL7460856.1 tautomerase family protein [Micromonospora sp. MSM11]MDT0528941.1 tautomerase family protein [Micromonospora sp. DSM 115977]RLK25946.1 phenylpyruvate tautomerase PptA (4-oxalocrotonate tautomerase family) [Micromonospora sp. M71_S20]SCG16148.1 4-oxalocrotonate tautomerase [Micromonospora echinofusca]
MAIIRAEIGKRDQETKNAIIAELTDVLVKYGSPRENTHVLLYEVSYDNWAKGGLTYNERKKQAQESS